MSSIAPRDPIPARPTDALIDTLPISKELADILAYRVARTTYRWKRTGCWLRDPKWCRSNGYSYISRTVKGKVTYYLAHRVMYVHHKGEIPVGYTIDHLCEELSCVNPDHLQAVTHRQNVLQSRTNPFAINARATRRREGVQ